MNTGGEVWAIVLAGGGGDQPKQFAPHVGGATPFALAIARAQRLVSKRHIIAVVVREQERWWRSAVAALPRENVLVEPKTRGTAPAVLFAALHVLERDPAARVIVLPSDHYIACEDRMQDAIALALSTVGLTPFDQRIVLIGVSSQAPDTNLGWILPEDTTSELSGVSAFIEKPQPATAAALFERNAWWSTMIFATTPSAIHRAYERAAPELSRSTNSRVDLSSRVFQHVPSLLRALKAPDCGWLDLGSVEHLMALERRFPRASVPIS